MPNLPYSDTQFANSMAGHHGVAYVFGLECLQVKMQVPCTTFYLLLLPTTILGKSESHHLRHTSAPAKFESHSLWFLMINGRCWAPMDGSIWTPKWSACSQPLDVFLAFSFVARLISIYHHLTPILKSTPISTPLSISPSPPLSPWANATPGALVHKHTGT